MWRSIFSNFSVRVLAAILNLGLVILFSQVGGLIGKGEQSLLLTSIAILTIFDALIGGAALVNFSTRFAWSILLRTSYVWILCLTFVAGLLLYVLEVFSPIYLLNVLFLSMLSAVTAVHSSLLLGQKRFVAYNLIQISIPLLTFFTCLFQYYFFGKLYYEWSLYLAFGFALVLSSYFIWYYWPKGQTVPHTFGYLFKQLLSYGTFNQLAHVFQILSFRASFYFLEYYHGKGTVGLFSNASSLTESVWLIATSISLWQYAVIANSNDSKYNIQLTEKLTRFGMTTAFLACLTLAILPGSFYGFLFGADFAALHPIMWLLAPGVWLFSYALIVGHYFSGHGRYQVNALASGIGLIVSLIGAILLIPSYGTEGAAVAASLSYFVTSAIVFLYFKKAGGQFTLFLQFEELKSFQTQVRQRLRSIRS